MSRLLIGASVTLEWNLRDMLPIHGVSAVVHAAWQEAKYYQRPMAVLGLVQGQERAMVGLLLAETVVSPEIGKNLVV